MQLLIVVVSEGEGLEVRCGRETHFLGCTLLCLFEFFPYVCVSCLEQNKTSYFFKSVSPEANLERRPAATCQFPQFFPGSRPLTVCSASGHVLEYRMRVRDVYRHCSVSSGNFICDPDGYIQWLVVFTPP